MSQKNEKLYRVVEGKKRMYIFLYCEDRDLNTQIGVMHSFKKHEEKGVIIVTGKLPDVGMVLKQREDGLYTRVSSTNKLQVVDARVTTFDLGNGKTLVSYRKGATLDERIVDTANVTKGEEMLFVTSGGITTCYQKQEGKLIISFA